MAKILIVDDDPDFVEATRMVLEKAGHTTLSAASGNECYDKMKSEKPDLVILDVIMDTVLDGLTVTQRIHDDEEINQIPIVMVTSIANTDYAELFPTDEYIHINAFMSKPVAPADLIRQVNKLLK
ncbi:MAG: response regulator [Chloroflexota bacterium]